MTPDDYFEELDFCLVATTRDGQKFALCRLESLNNPSGWCKLQEWTPEEYDLPYALVRIEDIVSITVPRDETGKGPRTLLNKEEDLLGRALRLVELGIKDDG